MQIAKWNIENITGYKPITTYFEDFSIAENFGTKAIIDTYNTAKKELATDFLGNYKELTELVMALNWKIWQHYQNNEKVARTYNTLWQELDGIAQNELTGEALTYFYNTTD